MFRIMGPRECECQGERKVDILMHVPISTITLSTLPLDFLILFLLSLFSLFSPFVFFFSLPLGLPWPTYFIFTSYSSHGPTGCYLCHVGPLSLLPLFQASSTHLLHLCLLFFQWACWLLFLPCWPIEVTNLLLPFLFLFLSISLIVGLLLLLGLS